MRVVIALGGNAISSADGAARPEEQRRAIEAAAGPIADIVAAGHEVVITHGNGPQVGNLLVKNELAASVVPPVGLDWCGAQTQATIGFLLLNALDRALARSGSRARTAVLVSRTLVAAGDPGFAHPTKPIGRYAIESDAKRMMAHGQRWEDRAGEGGWRRVVASPEPLECLDSPAVVALLASGFVVVCSGGGGIPVVAEGDGVTGVEAVIDKDLTASLLAASLNADVLVIATDVDGAVEGWGTASPRPIGRVGVGALRALARAGEFTSGSMGPKVEAACRFAERTGKPAVITSLERLATALDGSRGTVVTADR